MTTQTLPSGGGSWIRQKDGSLTLDEAPTALEAPAVPPVEPPVEGGVKASAKPKNKEA